jgi:hypothetical protein
MIALPVLALGLPGRYCWRYRIRIGPDRDVPGYAERV